MIIKTYKELKDAIKMFKEKKMQMLILFFSIIVVERSYFYLSFLCRYLNFAKSFVGNMPK